MLLFSGHAVEIEGTQGCVLVVRDVSERRKAEEKLRHGQVAFEGSKNAVSGKAIRDEPPVDLVGGSSGKHGEFVEVPQAASHLWR